MRPEDLEKQLTKCLSVAGQDSISTPATSALSATPIERHAKKSKGRLNDVEKDFVNYMTKSLPPVIGRAEVEKYLPGIVKPQTLAKADSAGIGPEVSWKVGRKVAYRTDSLIMWLVDKCGINRMANISKLIS